MSKYRNNTSIGLIGGLSAAGVAYIVIQVFHVIHGINQLNEVQKENKFTDSNTIIIITDTITGKKDTMLLSEYQRKLNEKQQH